MLGNSQLSLSHLPPGFVLVLLLAGCSHVALVLQRTFSPSAYTSDHLDFLSHQSPCCAICCPQPGRVISFSAPFYSIISFLLFFLRFFPHVLLSSPLLPFLFILASVFPFSLSALISFCIPFCPFLSHHTSGLCSLKARKRRKETFILSHR